MTTDLRRNSASFPQKPKKKKIRFRRVLFLLFALTVLVTFAFLFLFPTVFTITNSFMSTTEISANYGKIFTGLGISGDGGRVFIAEKVNLQLIPERVSFSQYATVLLKSPEYLLKFWNSVIYVLPIVIFQLVVAAGASYCFSRVETKFRSIVFFMYIILMLMPYQVTLVPNYLVSEWLGLLNTRWAIIFPGAFAPFSVFLLTKFMRRIPVAQIEAAKLDGSSEWQIFTRIYLPQCRSALYSIAILVFIDYWNMVEQPLILLNDAELQPLSVYLSTINAGEIGLAFAVATIYMIPSLLMFLHGEEYLVEGIAQSGSVKG